MPPLFSLPLLLLIQHMPFYKRVCHIFPSQDPYQVSGLYYGLHIRLYDGQIAAFDAYYRAPVLLPHPGILYGLPAEFRFPVDLDRTTYQLLLRLNAIECLAIYVILEYHIVSVSVILI